VRALAPPLTAILVAAAVGLYVAQFDFALAVAFLFFLALAGLGIPLLAGWLSSGISPRLVERRSALNIAIVDSLQGLPDLAVCNQLAPQARRIDAISLALSNAQKKMAVIQGLQTASVGLLANLGTWVVLFLSIRLVQSGQLEGVYLAVILLAVLSSFEAIVPLPQAAQYLQGNLKAARRLFEVVDTKPEVQDQPAPRPLPADFSLEVNDLRFRYPPSIDSSLAAEGDPPYTLDGLSFSLPMGRRLAIVGPSGAGKSTLLGLLLRFWEYEQGQVLLGGHDLRQVAQDDLRSSLGVVSQRTDLFNASLRDNLRIARPNATQAEIDQAVERAQLQSFIQSLPDGYDTWIGEQGLRLSGGERQRLAIARALLKDPPLMILDEGTANLDPLTERQVLASIADAMQGRAILMITHRLAGLEAMDEILVLEAGKVVERGTHTELLELGGLYRRMWDLQNQILLEQA
jgi:thiol reductant ABC exporter CydC subunit